MEKIQGKKCRSTIEIPGGLARFEFLQQFYHDKISRNFCICSKWFSAYRLKYCSKTRKLVKQKYRSKTLTSFILLTSSELDAPYAGFWLGSTCEGKWKVVTTILEKNSFAHKWWNYGKVNLNFQKLVTLQLLDCQI